MQTSWIVFFVMLTLCDAARIKQRRNEKIMAEIKGSMCSTVLLMQSSDPVNTGQKQCTGNAVCLRLAVQMNETAMITQSCDDGGICNLFGNPSKCCTMPGSKGKQKIICSATDFTTPPSFDDFKDEVCGECKMDDQKARAHLDATELLGGPRVDEQGYLDVAGMGSVEAMKDFIRHIVAERGWWIIGESGLSGFAPWYVAPHVQSLARMLQELQDAEWVGKPTQEAKAETTKTITEEPMTTTSSEGEESEGKKLPFCGNYDYQGGCPPDHPKDSVCVNPAGRDVISCVPEGGLCPDKYVPCTLKMPASSKPKELPFCGDYKYQGVCPPDHPKNDVCVNPAGNETISCLPPGAPCPTNYVPCTLEEH